MAKLLTGTRIYGTGTVDTQLFVSGTNSATSTTTGALQVVGGVGIGGNLHVGGTIFGGIISGTASTATNSDNIKTVLSTSTSVFFPVFVDSNNATAGYEAVYSSSTFTIIPSSGNVGIGVATPTEKLHVAGNYVLLKNTADTAAGAVLDSGSTLGQNTQILLRDRGSDKWAIRKNSANDFDIYGSAAGTVALTIFSSTNFIGIGTPTPLSKFVVYGGTVNSTTYTSSEARIADGTLHLMKTSAGGVFEALRAINNDVTAGTTVRLLAAATSDPFNNANGGKVFIDAVRTASNMDLIFSLNDASGAAAVERLRILGSGAIAFNGSTNYGVGGQILQSNGNAAPTWISTGSLAAANATTATHLAGGVAGQIPYQTAPGVTSFVSTGTAGNVLVSNGSSAPTYNNTLTLTGTTAATSTTTGALQVVGGVGVGGDLFIRGDILTNDTTFNLINANATTVNFAGAATALTMGASGSGTTNVRNNLTVSGNLTVQGTTTIVDSTVTNIADPILTLGGSTGNTAPTADDNKDRGVAFKWVNNGGTTSTGFFGYDDSTGHFTYVQTATITNEVVSGTKGAMDVNLAGGTAMSIVYQSSPNNTGFLAAGSSGFILQTNGTGSPPTWVSASGVSAGSATNADNIRTILQAGNAVYYPTFVDSNNASHAYESVYTTGTFVINPATGNIGMGTASPQRPLHVVTIGTTTQGIAAFEAKASGFVIQDNGSQNGNVELVGYKQTSSTYHNILIRGSGDGLLVQTGTGNVGIGDTAPGTKLTVLGAGGSTLGTNGYLVHVGGTDSSVDPVRYMIGFSHGNNSTSTNVRAAIGGMVTTGGAGNLIFETGSSGNQVERMRITGSGGVSFGTGGANYGSSGQILQSNGNAAPTWVTAISGSSAQVNTVLRTTSAAHYLTFVDSNNASATAESIYTTSSFSINPATGNVGVGTSNPTAKLTISNTGSTTAAFYADIGNPGSAITLFEHTGASTPVPFRFRKSGFSGASPNYGLFYLHMNDGTVGNGSNLYFNLNNSAGTEIEYAGLGAIIRSNTAASEQGDLAFYVISTGTSRTERLRITSAGALAFSGSSNFGSAGQILQSNGNAPPTWVSVVSNATYLASFDDRIKAPSDDNAGSLRFGFTSYANNNTAPWADYLHLRSYTDATGGNDNLLMFRKDAIGMRVWQQAWGSATAYATYKDVAFTDSSISGSSGQVQTILQTANATYYPTFVDSNNAAAAAENVYTTSSFTINAQSGNVGIGISGSSSKLSVSGANSSSLPLLDLTASGTGTYQRGVRLLNSGMNVGDHIMMAVGTADNSRNMGQFYFYNAGAGSTSNRLSMGLHSVDDVFNILGTGNVGIGTTTPQYKLDVNNGATGSNSFQASFGATFSAGFWSGIHFGYSEAANTNYRKSAIIFERQDSSARGKVHILNNGTASGASATLADARLTITFDGNVGIGTTSPTNKFEVAGTAGQLFSISDSFTGTIFSANDVSGIPSIEVLDTGLVKLAQYNGSVAISTGTAVSGSALSVYGIISTIGTTGEIRASSEITAYYSSDRRLKENIKLIENPITILDQIRGVTFDWTDEHMARRGGEDGYFVRKHDIGVIAQEVQAVLPELVGTREDGYLAVKYEKMVALLIEAIKEQQKSIDMLKIELEKIKKQ